MVFKFIAERLDLNEKDRKMRNGELDKNYSSTILSKIVETTI